VSHQTTQIDTTPVDHLIQIASLLTKLPGGNRKFVPLLLAKVHELLPDLVPMLCSAVDIPFNAFDDPMSPDTRFVYEEEVGRGLYTDLRRDR
jgi:SP family general alpha glucoside:H+ symporter-like MFS transporter